MTSGDEYLFKAAEFLARAEDETDPALRAELENLGRAYLRLATQAKANSLTDVTYEPPPPKLDAPK